MVAFEASPTWWGVHLEFTHDEVEAVTAAHDIDQALSSIAGVLPPPYDSALAVAARHFAMRAALIKELDQNNGVTLMIPWSAIWWGQWWLIITNTR